MIEIVSMLVRQHFDFFYECCFFKKLPGIFLFLLFPSARDELHRMLNEDELRESILLVFANKQDQAGALGAQGVSRTRVCVCVRTRACVCVCVHICMRA